MMVRYLTSYHPKIKLCSLRLKNENDSASLLDLRWPHAQGSASSGSQLMLLRHRRSALPKIVMGGSPNKHREVPKVRTFSKLPTLIRVKTSFQDEPSWNQCKDNVVDSSPCTIGNDGNINTVPTRRYPTADGARVLVRRSGIIKATVARDNSSIAKGNFVTDAVKGTERLHSSCAMTRQQRRSHRGKRSRQVELLDDVYSENGSETSLENSCDLWSEDSNGIQDAPEWPVLRTKFEPAQAQIKAVASPVVSDMLGVKHKPSTDHQPLPQVSLKDLDRLPLTPEPDLDCPFSNKNVDFPGVSVLPQRVHPNIGSFSDVISMCGSSSENDASIPQLPRLKPIAVVVRKLGSNVPYKLGPRRTPSHKKWGRRKRRAVFRQWERHSQRLFQLYMQSCSGGYSMDTDDDIPSPQIGSRCLKSQQSPFEQYHGENACQSDKEEVTCKSLQIINNVYAKDRRFWSSL